MHIYIYIHTYTHTRNLDNKKKKIEINKTTLKFIYLFYERVDRVWFSSVFPFYLKEHSNISSFISELFSLSHSTINNLVMLFSLNKVRGRW